MSTIFTNTTFFADPDPVTNYRTPVALNFEDPDNPDGGGGDVGNPDGGGTGGGTGGGGDIGDVGGNGTTTIGDAPNITRTGHDQQVFVSSNDVVTLTYTADGDCTLFPRMAFKDMTTSYSDNGRVLTVSWTVPAAAAGDSVYVGATCWVYGADDEVATTTVWDIVHINKVAEDVKVIGTGTAHDILQRGIERTDLAAGDTIIINDATYSDFEDVLMIGYWGGVSGNSSNLVTPNGVSASNITVDVIGSDGTTVTGTEQIKDISKYTCIMAATPMGVVLDRQHRRHTSHILGNFRSGSSNGNREAYGIKIKGISFINCINGPSFNRSDSCSYEYCHVVNNTTAAQYEAATGDTTPGHMNGGIYSLTSARSCHFEFCGGIFNNRFGVVYGAGSRYLESATKHSDFNRGMLTNACSGGFSQNIVQAIVGYGCRSFNILNNLCVDGFLFKDGHQGVFTLPDAELADSEHASFIITNNSGDDVLIDGFISLNTTTTGARFDLGTSPIRCTLKNSVFWGKAGGVNTTAMINTGAVDIVNVTVGKNEYANPSFSASCIYDLSIADISKTLCLSGAWDYSYKSADVVIRGTPNANDDEIAFFGSGDNSQQYKTRMTSAGTDYYEVQDADIKASGAHYISRVEDDSLLSTNDVGCQDVFPLRSSINSLHLDNNTDYYDGVDQYYANWLEIAPWELWCQERRKYSCTVDGVTYTGNTGISKLGVHPVDYINSFGTSPLHGQNCPPISLIFGKALGSGNVNLWWRPVAVEYRSSITGINVFIDGIKVTETPLSKSSTSISLDTINTGTRDFTVQLVDPVRGNSGLSRKVTLVVT